MLSRLGCWRRPSLRIAPLCRILLSATVCYSCIPLLTASHASTTLGCTPMSSTTMSVSGVDSGSASSAPLSTASASAAAAPLPPGHVVLLGDSILDNGSYVRGKTDVLAQVQAAVPAGWRVTLLAVDGAVTRDVSDQLRRLPADATHLVVSAGGNDALGASGLLQQRVSNVGEAVALMAGLQRQFQTSYTRMLDELEATKLPVTLCTIYDANHPEPHHTLVATSLSLFNDVITRGAFSRRFSLVDLRLLFSGPDDYANSIEPGVKGGAKIAHAVARIVQQQAQHTQQNQPALSFVVGDTK